MPSGGTSSPPSTRRSGLRYRAAGHPDSPGCQFRAELLSRASLVRHTRCWGVGRAARLGVSGPGLRRPDMAQCGRARPEPLDPARTAHGGEPHGSPSSPPADGSLGGSAIHDRGPVGGRSAHRPAVHSRYGAGPGARRPGRGHATWAPREVLRGASPGASSVACWRLCGAAVVGAACLEGRPPTAMGERAAAEYVGGHHERTL